MIIVGQPAPDFTLPDSDMRRVSLSGFKNNKCIVLYFYPKDFSSNSTKEAIDFTDMSEEFEQLDTVIMGVSTDSCMRHAAFRDEHGLSILLLADMEGEVCRLYGALQGDSDHNMGRRIVRCSFIIDKPGIVRDVQYGIRSIVNANEMLARVKAVCQ
jgi:peroxiredoxin Q/BCP